MPEHARDRRRAAATRRADRGSGHRASSSRRSRDRLGVARRRRARRTAAWRSTTCSRRSSCRQGGEVIFPALTFWVVPEMVRVAGLTPVFADVDPRTFNLDPAAFERAITDRTVAVVPTHLYGLPCDMDAIMAIARAARAARRSRTARTRWARDIGAGRRARSATPRSSASRR